MNGTQHSVFLKGWIKSLDAFISQPTEALGCSCYLLSRLASVITLMGHRYPTVKIYKCNRAQILQNLSLSTSVLIPHLQNSFVLKIKRNPIYFSCSSTLRIVMYYLYSSSIKFASQNECLPLLGVVYKHSRRKHMTEGLT